VPLTRIRVREKEEKEQGENILGNGHASRGARKNFLRKGGRKMPEKLQKLLYWTNRAPKKGRRVGQKLHLSNASLFAAALEREVGNVKWGKRKTSCRKRT